MFFVCYVLSVLNFRFFCPLLARTRHVGTLRTGHFDEFGGLERGAVNHVRALGRGGRHHAILRIIHGPDPEEQERDHQTGDHQHGQQHGQPGDERRYADAHVVGGLQPGPGGGHDDSVDAAVTRGAVVGARHVQSEINVARRHHLYDAAGVHVQLGVGAR